MRVRPTTAKYHTPISKEHSDNPLICALPPMVKAKRLADIMRFNPGQISKDDFIELRMRKIKDLRNLVVITQWYPTVYYRLLEVLIDSYKSRNPLDVKYVGFTYDVADPNISVDELRKNDFGSNKTTTLENLIITGLSGIGKTKLLFRLLYNMFPQVIVHQRPDFNEIQIPFLIVNMPHDGSRPTLLERVLEELDNVLEGHQERQYDYITNSKTSFKVNILERTVRNACIKYNVGIVIVDEFQNLTVANSKTRDEMIQLFDSLTEIIKVPFAKIGTPETEDMFDRLRNGRRLGHPINMTSRFMMEVKRYDINCREYKNAEREWRKLVEKVVSYQITEKDVALTEPLISVLERLSCGLPYVLIELWIECQIEAIKMNKKNVTVPFIKDVYERRFKLIKPALDALRKGNSGLYTQLLDADQRVVNGDLEGAIYFLSKIAKSGEYTGRAANDILLKVEEIETNSDFSPAQLRELDRIKKSLKQFSATMKPGQVIEQSSKSKQG